MYKQIDILGIYVNGLKLFKQLILLGTNMHCIMYAI